MSSFTCFPYRDLIFEKAYCFYRLNKHREALATIVNSENEIDYRTKELKAQISYRLEEYKDAHVIYQDIIKNTDDEYEEERLTNLYATMVYLDEDDRVGLVNYLQRILKQFVHFKVDIELKDDAYELCYNKACMLIASEEYAEAEKKLKQCEKLCREKFEEDEDISDEEIDIELALIR